MERENILAELSERQREAAAHLNGPLLIVAGPGSGKTRVMAHRVAYLIGVHRVPADRILAVTFTNKAARELSDRCEQLVPNASGQLHVRTFHGFCAWMLRMDGGRAGLDTRFSIYDDDDQVRTIRSILLELDLDPKRLSPRSVLNAISGAKNRMLDATAYDRMVASQRFPGDQSAYFHEIVARVYPRYTEALDRSKAVDFDDLLFKAHELLDSAPDVLERYQDRFQHLLVDEFQDTNPLQFNIARLLAVKNRNIAVVGDPDQSIYSWRHADPGNLSDFLKIYRDAKVVTLDQSYRSTQTILEAAAAVISHNEQRLPKELWTANDRGAKVYVAEAYDEEEEARAVVEEIGRLTEGGATDSSEIAVMYRVNAQSRAMESACNRIGMPYRLVGGVKFYERREVKDVLSYLRLAHNPADDAALMRIINVPARGISTRTVEVIRRQARSEGTPMLATVLSTLEQEDENGEQPALVALLQKRALNSVRRFAGLMQDLIDQSLTHPPHELIDRVLDRSGYARLLEEDEDRGDERWENIKELRGSAEQFAEMSVTGEQENARDELSAFLENIALVSDVDRMDDERADAVTLITLHQAKGLEFDVVFIIGLEEGLLPHSRSMDDPAQLQEERRLCYVGMTRARERLFLLHAFQRGFRGTRGPSLPSRFLDEVPVELVSLHHLHTPGRSYGYRTSARTAMTGGRRTSGSRVESKVSPAVEKPEPVSEYAPGDRVVHEVFGEGVVVSAKESRGDIEVTVAFGEEHGVKRLMLNFAPMVKIDGTQKTRTDSDDRDDEDVDPVVKPFGKQIRDFDPFLDSP